MAQAPIASRQKLCSGEPISPGAAWPWAPHTMAEAMDGDDLPGDLCVEHDPSGRYSRVWPPLQPRPAGSSAQGPSLSVKALGLATLGRLFGSLPCGLRGGPPCCRRPCCLLACVCLWQAQGSVLPRQLKPTARCAAAVFEHRSAQLCHRRAQGSQQRTLWQACTRHSAVCGDHHCQLGRLSQPGCSPWLLLQTDSVLGRGSFKTVYRAFDEAEAMEVAWNQVLLQQRLQQHLHSVLRCCVHCRCMAAFHC